MKKIPLILLAIILFGCSTMSNGRKGNEYDSTAVTLTDFSKKVMGYLNFKVPKNFNKKEFFAILEKEYPDKSTVKNIQKNFRISLRYLDGGGYSIMLCDPKTGQKIMEDLSCHLDRVEIQSWENPIISQCAFASDWKSYCQ